MTRRAEEAQLQRRVVGLMTRYGWYVLEMDRAGMRRTFKKGAFKVGFPDLLGLKGSRFVLIELKSDAGAVRPEQVALHTLLAGFGIHVHLCRTDQEVLDVILKL